MTARRLVFTSLAALALAAPLAGCGKMGELDRPGPLFGSTTRTADEQERQKADPARPADTVDPRTRATDPAPPRTLPLEGQSGGSGAFDQPPQGALPNPFANPR